MWAGSCGCVGSRKAHHRVLWLLQPGSASAAEFAAELGRRGRRPEDSLVTAVRSLRGWGHESLRPELCGRKRAHIAHRSVHTRPPWYRPRRPSSRRPLRSFRWWYASPRRCRWRTLCRPRCQCRLRPRSRPAPTRCVPRASPRTLGAHAHSLRARRPLPQAPRPHPFRLQHAAAMPMRTQRQDAVRLAKSLRVRGTGGGGSRGVKQCRRAPPRGPLTCMCEESAHCVELRAARGTFTCASDAR